MVRAAFHTPLTRARPTALEFDSTAGFTHDVEATQRQYETTFSHVPHIVVRPHDVSKVALAQQFYAVNHGQKQYDVLEFLRQPLHHEGGTRHGKQQIRKWMP